MQTTPRTKPHREIARLAIWAGLIAFLLPLLPLYGDGSGPFIFSSGLSLRFLISFLLVWWTNAVVVTVGILYLRRDRIGVAGGLFLAAALTVAIAIYRASTPNSPPLRPLADRPGLGARDHRGWPCGPRGDTSDRRSSG
jgi:cytosine/uracil/thiamine/allantoin permease